MVYLRKRLAQFIRLRRGKMTQRDFARRLGVAQATVMRMENEEQNVTLDTLERLCVVLKVEIGELFPPVSESAPVRHYRHQPRPAIPTGAGAVHEQHDAERSGPPQNSGRRSRR